MDIIKIIEEFYPEETFIKLDGLDIAIIGVDSKSNRIIYSVKKIIDILEL